MSHDITDPNYYLKSFEEGIKRFFASTSEPSAQSSTASHLAGTGTSASSTAPLQPIKLPSVKTEPEKTPDYFTHSANEGINSTVFLPKNDPPARPTLSRQVSSTPASPATPVTPNRPPSITTGRQRTAPVDKARIADYKTDAVEYGDERRSVPSRPNATPDYAAAAANEGFVPIAGESAPGSSVSKAEKERVRQYRQTMQEQLGNQGHVTPLKLNPSLSSPVTPEEKTRNQQWTRSAREQLGNEGYVAPLELNPALSSPVSAEEKARTQEWVRNAREQLGHEGGTLPDNLAERVAEFHRNVQKNATVIDRFLRENDRIERSAYGIPARGEDSQSVFKMYLAAKTESDNAENPDWKRAILDFSASKVGQIDMDTYHSLAAGGYDLGNTGLSAGTLFALNDLMPNPHGYTSSHTVTGPALYTDPDTGVVYYRDNWGYATFNLRQQWALAAQRHRNARSDDFKHASFDNPAYLPVQKVGKEVENLGGLLVLAAVARVGGPQAEMPTASLLAAASEYSRAHDEIVTGWLTKPEELMWQNPAYCAMRRKGIPDHETRYIIGHTLGKNEGYEAAIRGIGRTAVAYGVNKVTRTGTEGGLLETGQDIGTGMLFDAIFDFKKNNTVSKDQKKDR